MEKIIYKIDVQIENIFFIETLYNHIKYLDDTLRLLDLEQEGAWKLYFVKFVKWRTTPPNKFWR
jgi:hypothetical protein